MDRLRKRAMEEKDKQAGSKEIRMIRKLLRAANAAKAADGELPEEQKPLPEVSPPDFINACKAILINFGNLGDGDISQEEDLASRMKTIASEAEIVATRIYGKGMTAREQQAQAWKETTTSIFDLETME